MKSIAGLIMMLAVSIGNGAILNVRNVAAHLLLPQWCLHYGDISYLICLIAISAYCLFLPDTHPKLSIFKDNFIILLFLWFASGITGVMAINDAELLDIFKNSQNFIGIIYVLLPIVGVFSVLLDHWHNNGYQKMSIPSGKSIARPVGGHRK